MNVFSTAAVCTCACAGGCSHAEDHTPSYCYSERTEHIGFNINPSLFYEQCGIWMRKMVHMTVVGFTTALLSKIFFSQTWHVESLTAGRSVFPHIFACSVAEIPSKAGSLLTGDFITG